MHACTHSRAYKHLVGCTAESYGQNFLSTCWREQAKTVAYRVCSLNEHDVSAEPEFGSKCACVLVQTIGLKRERSFDRTLRASAYYIDQVELKVIVAPDKD